MNKIIIRPATSEDVSAITEIYNCAIRTSTATFDMVEKTIEDRHRWLSEHGDRYPVVVTEVDGQVAGWGSLSRYGERPGWRFTVEDSIYIDEKFRGMGIGKAILNYLLSEAERLGYRAVIAQVISGNEASIRLHEKCGFEMVGVLKEAGNKFDQWLDVILMEKLFPGPRD